MEFNFDQLQTNDVIAVDEAGADLTVHKRVMVCVCPACTEKTEVNLAQMPEQLFVITCSSCANQIHVIRESCACRAKRKSFEINCTHCGKLLDKHAHCISCGKSFPDFYVTVDPEKARSESRKAYLKKVWATITGLNVSFKPSFKSTRHNAASSYSPTRTRSGESTLLSRKYMVPALGIFAAIALCAGGVFAYKTYTAGQMYAENYIKALYCIKTGVDSNLKKCVSNKVEWETASASGRSFLPSSNLNEETKAAKLRTEIDKNLQLLHAPPKKYSQADTKLKEIYKIYLEAESLTQARPASLGELSRSIDTLDKKMSQASQELKSNLFGSLKQELEKAKLKYRGLKDF
ncbi:MAG: hypothetical protein PHF56_01520 [Desulfuromonadaceae bacterium]|nr:hypothetical protein [Desulfuromonadaceae bacterium]